MTPDIQRMIDLQNINLSIRETKQAIETLAAAVKLSKEQSARQSTALSALNDTIRSTKIHIKDRELLLGEIDTRAKKNALRLESVTTERESEALQHEAAAIKDEMGTIEEDLISSMDSLTSLEEQLQKANKEIEIFTAEQQNLLEKQRTETERLQQEIVQKQSEFDSLAKDLDNSVKARFLKLLTSKKGIGITPLHGDVCGACNYKVATSLKAEACAGQKAMICANCGCYFYGEGNSLSQ